VRNESRAARYWIALGLAMAACLSGAPASAAPASPPPTSAKVLAKYLAAMADLPKPSNMIFTYSETRTGPTRIVSGLHRVYRDKDGNQRNDTLAINDQPIRPPSTQTFQRASWPYFADQFSVPPSDYDVRFAGTATVNGRRAYVYDTKLVAAAAFAIRQLAIDPATGLPLRELFTVATSDCTGDGEIDFMLVATYVLPSAVSAQCTMSGTGQFKDAMRFSDYSFPAAIPADVLHPSGASAG
jgi:hypothetical protein